MSLFEGGLSPHQAYVFDKLSSLHASVNLGEDEGVELIVGLFAFPGYSLLC